MPITNTLNIFAGLLLITCGIYGWIYATLKPSIYFKIGRWKYRLLCIIFVLIGVLTVL